MKRPAAPDGALKEKDVEQHDNKVQDDNNSCNAALNAALSQLRQRQLILLQWTPKLNACVVTNDRTKGLKDIYIADLAAKKTEFEELLSKILHQISVCADAKWYDEKIQHLHKCATEIQDTDRLVIELKTFEKQHTPANNASLR